METYPLKGFISKEAGAGVARKLHSLPLGRV